MKTFRSSSVFTSQEQITEARQATGCCIEYRRVGRTPYTGRLDVVRTRGMGLATETSSTATEVHGACPADWACVAFLEPGSSTDFHVNGRTFHGGPGSVSFGPGTQIDILARDATRLHQVYIPQRQLIYTFRRLGLPESLVPDARTRTLRDDRRVLADLYHEVGSIIDSSGESDLSVSERISTLVETWASAVAREHGAQTAPTRQTRSHRIRALRRARDWIHGNLDSAIAISDVCAHAGVSERTLERLFRQHYGVPPRRYVIHARLHSVRQLLRSADPGDTTVAATALRFGFAHLGRFSGYYKSLFGEPPKHTLGYRTAAATAPN